MNTVSQAPIIGIDVSCDWLGIHCLPDGKRLRLPITVEGHEQFIHLVRPIGALMCFEATGGQELRLWVALDGVIQRDEDREPNGVLEDYAVFAIFVLLRGGSGGDDRLCSGRWRALGRVWINDGARGALLNRDRGRGAKGGGVDMLIAVPEALADLQVGTTIKGGTVVRQAQKGARKGLL